MNGESSRSHGWSFAVAILLLVGVAGCVDPPQNDLTRLDGPYLGQTPPGSPPKSLHPES